MSAIIEAIIEFFARVFGEMLAHTFLGSILRFLRFLGAHALRILSGYKKPVTYFIKTDNFGAFAFIVGLGLVAGLTYLILKIFS